MAKRKRPKLNVPSKKDQPKPRQKRLKSGKKPWGNTNKARGKIRRWSKEQENISGIPDSRQWRLLDIFELSPKEADDLRGQWLAGEVNLTDEVVSQLESSDPEVYRFEIEVRWRPETQDDPAIAYQTREDFTIKDMFTARGKNWSQDTRGAHVEGFDAQFNYFIFEIDTGEPE